MKTGERMFSVTRGGNPRYSVSNTTWWEVERDNSDRTSRSPPPGKDRTIPLQTASLHKGISPQETTWDTIKQYGVAESVESGLKENAAHAVAQRGQMATQGNAVFGISWGERKAAYRGLSEGTRLFLRALGGRPSKQVVDAPPGKPSKEGYDCQLR